MAESLAIVDSLPALPKILRGKFPSFCFDSHQNRINTFGSSRGKLYTHLPYTAWSVDLQSRVPL
jgi:hypothetical protein